MKFNEYPLSTICSRLSSGKSIKSSQLVPSGKFPVYGGNGIRGFTESSNFSGTCAIIGRQGAMCGNVRYFVGDAYMTEHAVVVCGNELADTRYLYYLLSTLNLGRLSAQSAQPGLSVKTISKQIVRIPDIKYQRKISSFLGTFDDKIELNNKIIKNIENQIQDIYVDSFSKLTNYSSGKLSDILDLRQQKITPDDVGLLPYLPIDSIPCKSFAIDNFRPSEDAKSSLIRFKVDDILIGAMRVYFHRVAPAPVDGVTRNTCLVLTPKEPCFFAFCLATCNQNSCIDYAQSISKGSTMPYTFWDKGLSEYKVKIPDRDSITSYQKLVLPMVRQIQLLANENIKLRAIRETLLPKIISGEIELQDNQE